MAINLTYWLRKTPQPVTVLADEKRIEVPRNGRAWRDLTATISALEPTKLTALDGQGNVIRSIVLESEDDKAPEPTPEMSDVQLFAKLLADAYEKGSRSTQPVIDAAMRFVEEQSKRLTNADREIDRLRAVIHKQQLQIADLTGAASSAPGGDESLLGTIMAGVVQAQAGGNPLAVVGAGKGAPVKK